MIKQIKFYDVDNDTTFGGILLDDSRIICGCCGSIFEKDMIDDGNIVIKKIYDYWCPISGDIIGNDKD